MYECSEAMKKIINGLSPHYRSYLLFDDFTISNDELYSINTTHGSVSDKKIVPGCIISQTITVEAEITDNKISGKDFLWQLSGIDDNKQETEERIPMGEYTVVSCVKTNNHYKIDASDRLYKSDKLYEPKISFPAWSEDITADICEQIGVEYQKQTSDDFLTSKEIDFITSSDGNFQVTGFNYMIDKPVENITMREMLGFIAGLQGKFGIIDRYGKFVYKGYSSVSDDIFTNKIDEPDINEDEVGIYTLYCNIDKDGEKNIVVHPNTGGLMTNEITMYNPYMTQLLLHQISKTWIWRYMPCEIPLRIADPRIDVWDVYSFNGYKIPVMQLERKYDGGFSSTIKSEISDKEES